MPDEPVHPPTRRQALIARGEQVVLVILAVVVVAGVLHRAATYLGWGAEPIALEPPTGGPIYRVNVNAADWPTLALVPGLGEALSKRIVEVRDASPARRFASLDDLKRVKGIDEKILSKLRPYLELGAEDTDAEPVRMQGAP
jgi:hypothetical protein